MDVTGKGIQHPCDVPLGSVALGAHTLLALLLCTAGTAGTLLDVTGTS